MLQLVFNFNFDKSRISFADVCNVQSNSSIIWWAIGVVLSLCVRHSKQLFTAKLFICEGNLSLSKVSQLQCLIFVAILLNISFALKAEKLNRHKVMLPTILMDFINFTWFLNLYSSFFVHSSACCSHIKVSVRSQCECFSSFFFFSYRCSFITLRFERSATLK